ncbi:transglycosylase-like protein with SLT domain [Solirubrobacter pauli]|uniref:Transglycosylase-like protein with SLT domain n=1 Tax=Solirubrobacter pauli TaxID=166793 RepID=A0A660LFV2_9ACTN|nr:transglycosylase family protein [Solirubrobacter pauli]RKQ93459.1 transglycosylase-like protein with SLT domain [Solirubrobacter pauli]
MRRLVLIVCALLLLVPSAAAQDEGTLRDRIGSGKARERSLASAADRLAELERKAAREVSILEGRLGAAQTELNEAETRLASTEVREKQARQRVNRLRKRLAEVRGKLAGLLKERYMSDRPDFVTVVLHADGFPQLLQTLSFVKRVERADTRVLDLVRDARGEAGTEQRALETLAARQQQEAKAVRSRRDALANITAGLRERRDTLTRARAARQAALQATRSGRRKAERELNRLLAARARAARASGPGGPWAIPWAIVQCESGGQNLPPNHAGASGYYQFMPDTWRGLGGSTPHAYQASKAEQDRLAARLWAGGAGRHNWVCADLV